MMHGNEKSGLAIVAENRANADGRPAAEGGEPRAGAKGNTSQTDTRRTLRRASVSRGLERVRRAAKLNKEERFTALLHHVDVDLPWQAYFWLKPEAAPGVGGVTWQEYGQGLEDKLKDLHGRVHWGSYRALPTRRRYIPKPDGRQRPLGIAALEDKIVQRAVVEVLNAIYEEDFLGFSYGFRPGRSQHDALDALAVGITRTPVNWILDADIRSFFDTVSHDWLIRFVEHRIGDRRIVRLIRKWLKVGAMEEGELKAGTVGTPQGVVISPLLANIYLHYALDLWARQWRHRHAQGNVVVVRYADDLVAGFQYQADAVRFLTICDNGWKAFRSVCIRTRLA
jgi:RNA-directed DNA polymerase